MLIPSVQNEKNINAVTKKYELCISFDQLVEDSWRNFRQAGMKIMKSLQHFWIFCVEIGLAGI